MSKRRLAALLVAFAFLVSACNAEDETFVADYIKDILLRNPIGSIGSYLGADSGDPLIDLVMKGGDVLDAQDKRDKAFQKAANQGDTATMDGIIKLVPKDWGYRVTRGTVALEGGQISTYIAQAQEAEALADKAGKGMSAYRQELDELAGVERVLTSIPGAPQYRNKLQCTTLYDNLARVQGQIRDRGGSISLKDQAAWAEARKACNSLT